MQLTVTIKRDKWTLKLEGGTLTIAGPGEILAPEVTSENIDALIADLDHIRGFMRSDGAAPDLVWRP